jgi:hypothetical protein
MVKHVNCDHCGTRKGAKAGGVGTHSPGPVAGRGNKTAVAPSLARAAMIWRATDVPHWIPLSFRCPFWIPARMSACKRSNIGAFVGKSATSTACAAALAAASLDALAGPALLTK